MKKLKLTVELEVSDEVYEEDFKEQVENPDYLRELEKEEVESVEGVYSIKMTAELLEE